jgi:hypothetical protein
MANLKRVTKDNEKTTQTISLSGQHRNKLIKKAHENGLSLSAQISYIIAQYLKEEERAS